ncbi:FecR family protein [Cyclobacterium marinum]|uniref:FecR family protein n=1 Tax=Cyclobacterium marinum TaxID=104 RepID=UPI0011ED0592|nr:FecR domain-containing protein [Cyclobacterium marinum]MBI0398546.1 FecR domain-containing protein [Cyclobacterium marinum]
MHDIETIKELLIKYFNGSVSVIQKKWIDDWINESTRNEELFYSCLEEWERQNLQYMANVEQAFLDFNKRIDHGEPHKIENFPQQIRFNLPAHKLFMVASIVLIGLFFSGALDFVWVKTYRTGYGELSTLALNDGTVVYLNANSQLKTARFPYFSDQRQVELSGEASFDVAHDPINQFIVQTKNGLDVVVHGTEFTVYNRRQNTEVHLKSGKIELIKHNTSGRETVMMKPGEKARMEPDGDLQLKEVRATEEFASWKEYRYVFNQTSLAEISDLIKDNYGVDVEILEDSLNRLTVSGSFRSENAEEFATAVAQVLGVSIEAGENIFRFYDSK